MQTMLNKLRTYAEKKGLTVNTAKSEVVHFNSKSLSFAKSVPNDGVVLPEKDRFKYLGLLLDRRMNPKIAEEHAVRPYMAAQSRISEFAKNHDLKSRPHAMLWFYFACIVRCIGLCHYYQGEHNNSEPKREKTKD